MKQEYYVATLINGKLVPSSAIANGTLAKMQAVVNRLMKVKSKHPSVTFEILECIQ